MSTDRTEDSIIASFLGQLTDTERAELEARLKEDQSARELYADYQELLRLQDVVASVSYELEPNFALEVMESIVEQADSWSLSRFVKTLALTFPPTAIAVTACAAVFLFFPDLSPTTAPQSLPLDPTAGSFSEASFNDDLIRSRVSLIFVLLDNAVGSWIMLLSLLISLACFALRASAGKAYVKMGIVFLNIALFVFILRWLVSIFFYSE